MIALLEPSRTVPLASPSPGCPLHQEKAADPVPFTIITILNLFLLQGYESWSISGREILSGLSFGLGLAGSVVVEPAKVGLVWVSVDTVEATQAVGGYGRGNHTVTLTITPNAAWPLVSPYTMLVESQLGSLSRIDSLFTTFQGI